MKQPRRPGSLAGDLDYDPKEGKGMALPFAKSPFGAAQTPKNRFYTIVAIAGVFILALLVVPWAFSSGGALVSNGHLRNDKFPDAFRIAVIADLDQQSKKEGKNLWHSLYMTGTLKRTGEEYDVKWDKAAEVSTGHNEAGRGAELSELVRFHDKLYTFDDRTGIMFEIVNGDHASDTPPTPYIVPKHIFMEGDGASNGKGLKIEWATVKDNTLYVGSFGKEFTNNAGEVVHKNNLWVVTVTPDGHVTHNDWSPNYDRLRSELGYEHPAYLLHEAIVWSTYRRQWFVLPRRVSKQPYSEEVDEKMGSNTIITASHDFRDISATTVGRKTPERGFSSAKFLPGSRDTVLVALKSEESAETGKQRTYITIYGDAAATGDWKVLLEETLLPIDAKFEGLEVLSAV